MDKLIPIKALLLIRDNEYDIIISVFIDMVTQKILNYCNLKELPEELEYLVVELVYNHMRTSKQEFNPVESTSMGDTKVVYNTSPVPENILDDVKAQLNEFRVMDFT